ncbi:MAG TPA: hypothetical protein VHQ65_11220 [Thermoanaerobaculia bacterium]|nr:hypothetical protein [Thermoanaerobaculia bacterium]
MLAVARGAWGRVGPFDPGYFLYFEETDWLLRLRRAGLSAVYEPRAVARHRYAGSAAREPRAGRWFAESEERFVRRWYGDAWWRLVTRLGGRAVRRPAGWPPPLPPGSPSGDRPHPVGPAMERTALDPPVLAPPGIELARWRGAPLWIEVSPLARGFPAAAERLPPGAESWQLPAEIWQGLAPGPLRLAVVDERGRELAAWRAERVEP